MAVKSMRVGSKRPPTQVRYMFVFFMSGVGNGSEELRS